MLSESIDTPWGGISALPTWTATELSQHQQVLKFKVKVKFLPPPPKSYQLNWGQVRDVCHLGSGQLGGWGGGSSVPSLWESSSSFPLSCNPERLPVWSPTFPSNLLPCPLDQRTGGSKRPSPFPPKIRRPFTQYPCLVPLYVSPSHVQGGRRSQGSHPHVSFFSLLFERLGLLDD